MTGTLFLLPCTLGDDSSVDVFTPQVKTIVSSLTHFIVENQKSARKFIKFINPKVNQQELELYVFDKRSETIDIVEVLEYLKKGNSVGLISEAGLPCIADPGNKVVQYCHDNNIKVSPISGASSIILALIGSGMNGQNFAFNGYLPIDKLDLKKKLIQLESESYKKGSAQIFMETPFRNNALLENLLTFLKPQTRLCIASNITLDSESIQTKTISQWKKLKIDIHKIPTVFVIEG